ncbi:helix-turn-helix transcriptional regulator [Microbacterium keratanolyticum]
MPPPAGADANYFARSFREVFGLTPSEYRRLAGQT